MRRREFLLSAAAASSGLLLTGCPTSKPVDPWANASGKRKILVSFAPIYSFATNVAGEDAEVKCLLTTSGPHTHGDASPEQIELARGCDVFFINGLGLEDEADGIASKLEKVAANAKWNVVNLGAKIDKDWLREGSCTHDHGHNHVEHEHATDPHVWLSVRCAKKMVEGIRDELIRLDPPHAAGYTSRAAAYLDTLTKLEADGRAMLEPKKKRLVLSFHEALAYFGETYGIGIAGSIQLNPGQEPNDATLTKIIDKCKTHEVRVIAVEPQFSQHSSARLIRDALRGLKDGPIDAEFATVDPLETCDASDLGPTLYENVMRKNLAELNRTMR